MATIKLIEIFIPIVTLLIVIKKLKSILFPNKDSQKNNIKGGKSNADNMEKHNQDNWVDAQINLCRNADVKLNNAAKADKIIEVEKIVGYKFPNDFREFYQKVNGFIEWDFIGNMFSIWPLEKIANEYAAGDDKNFIAFCDHCIDLYRIGFII